MFTYSGNSTVGMAKEYRAEEASETRGSFWRARPRKRLRSPRPVPPSILTSRWWVATDALSGLGRAQGPTPSPSH